MLQNDLGCSPPVAGLITKLTTYRYKLPTGSPASPVLTNILCFQLDRRLYAFSSAYGIKYTRFIDDMTFSGRFIPVEFCEEVKTIIGEYGFILNDKKEELLTPYTLKEVTGINVNAKKVRVSRRYRRNLRVQKYQLEQAKDTMPKGEFRREKLSVFGKEQYVKMVRRQKDIN